MEDFVTVLNQKNFINFMQDDHKHAKVILFSKKSTPPPVFKYLSKEFKGRLRFGLISADNKELISRFPKINRYPRIITLHELDSETIDFYEGEITRDAIMEYLKGKAKSLPPTPKTLIRELNPDVYQSGYCNGEDSHYCFILFSQTSKDLQTSRAKLESLAERFKSDHVKFFVTSLTVLNTAQSFGRALKQNSMVMYNGKRRKFVEYPGDSTNTEGIANFIETTLSGSMHAEKIKSGLRFGKGREDL
jgi:DnaJ family protein C protein 16